LTAAPATCDVEPERESALAFIRAFSTRPRRGIKLGRLAYLMSWVIGQALALRSARRPDVIVAMYAPPGVAVVPCLAARLFKVPLLLDVRDIPVETAREIGYLSSPIILGVMNWLDRFVLARASSILVVSKAMVPVLQAKGAKPDVVEWSPIGYDTFSDTPANQQDPVPAVRDLFPPGTETLVVYVGTVGYLQNWGSVLEAFERLPSAVGLLVIGEGAMEREVDERIAKGRVNARRMGRIPKAQIEDVLTQADVALFPLRGDRMTGAMLGNKFFDYAGAGLPIVYSGPGGAVADLVDELRCGLVVPPEAPEALARAVMSLHRQPENRVRQGARGRQFALRTTAAASADRFAKIVASAGRGGRSAFGVSRRS